MSYSIQDINYIFHKYFSDSSGQVINKIVVDSRLVKKNDVFIALRGINKNGHDYVQSAFDNGASFVIVDHDLGDDRCIVVPDTVEAIRRICKFARNRFKGKIIAVTGSVGKTTTKEWLSYLLSFYGKTEKTFDNYNGRINSLLTLMNFNPNIDYGVIEVGMDNIGEIGEIARSIRPDTSIITSVAPAHLKNLISIENIAKEKVNISVGSQERAKIIVNSDIPFLDKIEQTLQDRNQYCIKYGNLPDNKYKFLDPDDFYSNVVNISIKDQKYSFTLPCFGYHHKYNILGILTLLNELDLDISIALNHISELKVPNGRGNVYEKDGYFIIDETFNANPESMSKTLIYFTKMNNKNIKRKIAILGDMMELRQSTYYHQNLIFLLNGLDKVFAYGKSMKSLYDILPSDLQGGYSENNINEILKLLHPKEGDAYLIKGSHNISCTSLIEPNGEMYSIVEYLLQ